MREDRACDRALHTARDGPDLERCAQVPAVGPDRDAGPGGARQSRDRAGRSGRPGPGRPAAHPGGGRRGGGGHRPRRDRVPDRLGGQHRAARGRRLRALRDDLLRPAGHGAGAAAGRGHRPAGGGGDRGWSPRCASMAWRTAARSGWGGRTESTPSRTCGDTGWPTSRSPWPAAGTGWPGPGTRSRSASCPARSAPTPTSTRPSRRRSCRSWASARRTWPPRWCSGTASRSGSARSR